MSLDTGRAVERNLLACALGDQICLEQLDVPPAAFESEAIRTTYSVICDLKKAGVEVISLATLRHNFDSRDDFRLTLERHGGAAFLENLASKPDLANFRLGLEQLKSRFAIRSAKNRASAALEMILETEFENPFQLYDLLDSKLIAMDDAEGSETFKFNEISLGWLDSQVDAYKSGAFSNIGHPITNPAMSEMFEELFINGSMYTWAGETNVGKSMIVQMLIDDQCIQGGIPTLVLDNELSRNEFKARCLSRIGQVPFKSLISGRAFNPESHDYAKLRTKLGVLEGALNHNLEWRSVLEMSIERIDPIVRRFLRQYQDYPHKQLIVDGIKLSTDSDSYLQVGFFAQKLKTHIAKRYADQGLIVHATCQLNRGGNSKNVQKDGDKHADHNSIGLSKLIADNSDDVLILTKHWDQEHNDFDPEKRRIYCTKARNHATLEGNNFLLCDFRGAVCALEPREIASNTKVERAQHIEDLTKRADPSEF